MANENTTRPGHSFYRKYGKRILDIILSAAALIILSPLLLILIILVRIYHGSPIFFTPTRPGKDEKIFKLYKFRTMSNARYKNGVMLADTNRVTILGKFLRASSLDELPELYNILIGDMSIVGPRPLAKNTLPVYTDKTRRRFEVRPGLTGLAQINGRNGLEWDKRFDYDLEYADKISFGYDLKIVLGTVLKVFKAADVTIPGTIELLSYNNERKIEIEGAPTPFMENGKRSEIGGDFWLSEEEMQADGKGSMDWLPEVSDSTLTFAGRSAIELALKDIMAKKPIRKAYVPSYISFGMLQPLVERGIHYEFYDVTWDGERIAYDLQSVNDADVLLIMNYFGIAPDVTDSWIRKFHEQGCIVIEDITHTLCSRRQGSMQSDYLCASLRKWFAVPAGGWLGKTNGTLAFKPDTPSEDKVHDIKRSMTAKADYMAGKTDEKKQYLIDDSNFECWLVLLDNMTKLDQVSENLLHNVDPVAAAARRKKNAERLYDRLSGLKGLRFMNHRSDWDAYTPLLVPVLLPNAQRNALEKELHEKGFYCPVTWAEIMGASRGFRDQELSLICDQRYTEEDMDRLADAVIAFFAKQA